MNEKNDFALVPKPPSAVEKIEPSAKRILAGMVGDALALAQVESTAKLPITMLVGKYGRSEFLARILKTIARDQYDVMLKYFGTEAELLKLTQDQPFDLIFLDWYHVHWDSPFVEVLGRIKTQSGKTIFVTSGFSDDYCDLRKRCEEVGVIYRESPFEIGQLKTVLEACQKKPTISPT